MGKGKTSSKAALKKKERLELQKKMDARVLIVKAANQQEDPLDTLPSFRVINFEVTLFIDRCHS